MEQTSISLPVVTFISFFGIAGSLVIWAFNTFETRSNSKEKYDIMNRIHDDIRKIEADISYIRGKMDD